MSEALNHLESVGIAFMPKNNSDARKHGRMMHGPSADNDGVAIFWRRARFELRSLDFLVYPDKKRTRGAVRAELEVIVEDGQVVHLCTRAYALRAYARMRTHAAYVCMPTHSSRSYVRVARVGGVT